MTTHSSIFAMATPRRGRFAPWLCLLLGLAACGAPGIELSISNIPAEATTLRIIPSIDGVPAGKQPEFDRSGDSLQVRLDLPAGTDGRLKVAVEALLPGRCALAGGEAVTDLGAAEGAELRVALAPLQRVLTVSKTGPGEGAVTSAPDGLQCGAACRQAFPACSTVRLTATPRDSAEFSGWSGACSGAGACQVTLDRDTSVEAAFGLPGRRVSVVINGSGAVTSEPAGLRCDAPTRCEGTFPAGTQVRLRATPADGYFFGGWTSGACSGTDPCVFNVNQDTTVSASFRRQDGSLAVNKSGSGAGTVTSAPAGIDCGTDCAEDFPKGTNVTLAATPDANSDFVGWTGPCSGTAPCSVRIDAMQTVGAQFKLKTVPLVVAKAGNGGGTISSQPVGINCGATCTGGFDLGTLVTLTPTADANANFVGWSGACSGAGACTVRMDAMAAVTATFQLKRYTLVVNLAGNGRGAVSGPSGIACGGGGACTAEFDTGTTVTLSAQPEAHTVTTRLSGACSGTIGCSFVIDGPKTVVATFTAMATMYQDGDFRGFSQQFAPGRYPSLSRQPIGNDSISSLKVPPGWTVLLCQDDNYEGGCRRFTTDSRDAADFGDDASSLIVCGPGDPCVP